MATKSFIALRNFSFSRREGGLRACTMVGVLATYESRKKKKNRESSADWWRKNRKRRSGKRQQEEEEAEGIYADQSTRAVCFGFFLSSPGSLVDEPTTVGYEKPRKPRWPLSSHDIASNRADGSRLECNSTLRPRMLYLPYFTNLRLTAFLYLMDRW